MAPINLEEITQAKERIAGISRVTPALPSVFLENQHNHPIILKLENLNLSGSFKIRGAANALLNEPKENLQRGVIAASAGNHAQGIAHIARTLGIKSTIFMPERTPLIKIESTRSLGAEVILCGQVFDDAYEAAKNFQAKTGALFIHPYADPHVINGQGTVGLELLQQVSGLKAVVVPIGGGGLISGIGCAIKSVNPGITIIGVQADAFPAMKLSFESGKHIKQKPIVTIADGIAVKTVHEINLELVRKYVDEIVTVGEDEIASAIMTMMERNQLLAEGAGAVSVAALNKLNLKKFKGGSVACIISGGNIDINLMRKISTKGLIHSGRLMRIRFTVADKPGALAEILKNIAQAGANINDVVHDRLFNSSHYNDVDVDAVIETASPEHQARVLEALQKIKLPFVVTNKSAAID